MIFADQRQSGRLDWEAVERATRGALHRAGAAAWRHWLDGPPPAENPIRCGCGNRARHQGRRPKRLVTVVGVVETERSSSSCFRCHSGRSLHSRLAGVLRELDLGEGASER